MAFCPQCGSTTPPQAAFCGVCGANIPPAPSSADPPAPAPPKPVADLGKKTMIGVANPLLNAPPPSVAQPSVAQPSIPQPSIPQAPMPFSPPVALAPAAVGKRTMVGMPAPNAALGVPAPLDPPAAAPKPADVPLKGKSGTLVMAAVSMPRPGAAPAVGKKTMIGMAPMSAPGTAGGAPVPVGKRTLLGIPVPEVVAKRLEPEWVEEEYEELVAETGQVERRVRRVAVPAPPVHKRPAFWLILGAAAIGIAGGLAILLAPRGAPLTAKPELDANGREMLRVTCPTCPDGTKIAVHGAAAAEMKGQTALVAPAAPLRVGKNDLVLDVDRPASGRDESITLTLPVGYRIEPDLGALQQPAPAIAIAVEAVAGSTVTVDAKPVALDANGKGKVLLDVTADLTGFADDVKQLARDVPYTVAQPGGAVETGKITVRIGVAPLSLSAPTGQLVTEASTFLLAGKVQRGAGLTAAGHPMSVGADGAFSQLMNISAEGSTEIELRTQAPPLAPRIAKLKVKRVASLAAEAKDRDAAPGAGYGDVVADLTAATGKPIDWKGTVLEASTQGPRTIAVLDVATGCAKKPCLARVAASAPPPLVRGDVATFYGRLLGAVTVRGANVPDAELDFFVKGP